MKEQFHRDPSALDSIHIGGGDAPVDQEKDARLQDLDFSGGRTGGTFLAADEAVGPAAIIHSAVTYDSVTGAPETETIVERNSDGNREQLTLKLKNDGPECSLLEGIVHVNGREVSRQSRSILRAPIPFLIFASSVGQQSLAEATFEVISAFRDFGLKGLERVLPLHTPHAGTDPRNLGQLAIGSFRQQCTRIFRNHFGDYRQPDFSIEELSASETLLTVNKPLGIKLRLHLQGVHSGQTGNRGTIELKSIEIANPHRGFIGPMKKLGDADGYRLTPGEPLHFSIASIETFGQRLEYVLEAYCNFIATRSDSEHALNYIRHLESEFTLTPLNLYTRLKDLFR